VPLRTLNEGREPKVKSLLLGHIRLGYFDEAKGYPRQSETLIFTSADADRLKPLQRELGGSIERYSPQGSGTEPWRLISDADAITVLFPFPDPEGNLSQSFELWGAGGIKRRCDGFTCALITVDEVTGEWSEEESPCLCDRDARECAPNTRLRVILPQTGLGIWELQTGSIIGATELHDQVRFIADVARGRMNAVPVRLVYAPRQINYFDAKKKKRSTTTKRVVHLSVAGDAAAALGALGAPEDRQLLEAVKLVLTPGEHAALPPGSADGDAPSGARAGEGSGGEATSTVVAPAATGPSPPEDSGELATPTQWAVAERHKLRPASILKEVQSMPGGEGITKHSAVTKAQMTAALEKLIGAPA
jgi:hypothetical protein